MAGRRLLLTRSEVQNVNYAELGAFRLRVDATDPSDSGADPNVFLFLRRPANTYDGSVLDDFHAVASPVDMAEYPAGEPRDGTAYPFFRASSVELDFRATSQAEEAWLLIVADVSNLLSALNRLDALTATQEVWVGAAHVDGGSQSSDSASQSS